MGKMKSLCIEIDNSGETEKIIMAKDKFDYFSRMSLFGANDNLSHAESVYALQCCPVDYILLCKKFIVSYDPTKRLNKDEMKARFIELIDEMYNDYENWGEDYEC